MDKFDLLKSHIDAYTHSDGTVVQAHDDRRTRVNFDDMHAAISKHKSAPEKQGFKEVDQQHIADGVHVDADHADHHHYFMRHDDGRKAVVFSHRAGNKREVGVVHGGGLPSGPGSRWVHPHSFD